MQADSGKKPLQIAGAAVRHSLDLGHFPAREDWYIDLTQHLESPMSSHA